MTTPAHPDIMTLKQMLSRSAQLYGNRVAFHLPTIESKVEPTISYAEFEQDVHSLGTALIDAGLQGKRIAIMGKNSYEWGLAYLAVMNGAGIAVPLDKELTAKELADSIERVNIEAIFYSDDVRKKIDTIRRKNKTITYIPFSTKSRSQSSLSSLLKKGSTLRHQGDQRYEKVRIDPNAMAALLFTSGTTSQSKIVMLSHSNIVSDMINGVAPFHLVPEDKFLSILPMHHMFECNAGFLAALFSGCSIYFSQGIRYIGQEFKEQQPSIVICVPRIVDALSTKIYRGIRLQDKEPLVRKLVWVTDALDKIGIHLKRKVFAQIHNELGGNIRLFLSGAAPISRQTIYEMTDLGFTIFQGYGLTECSPAVALTHFESNDIDSVGPPIANTKVRILEPDADGVGEVLVKGPHVMLGYYGDKKLTKSVMNEGFFCTGDLGYVKQDGSLKIIGRKKNVIVTSNGKKIYPEEIESLLLVSPAIKDVIVHAVESKHGLGITASVVLPEYVGKNERRKLEKEARAYIDGVNKNLAAYEQLHAVQIRDDDFVRTSTLKVKRHMINV